MNHQSDYGYSTGAVSMRCVACGSHELNCCNGTPRTEHDAHVRAYYDQPANAYAEYASSRYDGGTSVAVAVAYEVALDGGADDDFGSVDDWGYHARVTFDHAPFIVCFVQDSQGFISELSNSDYEAIWADYVEEVEREVAVDYDADDEG